MQTAQAVVDPAREKEISLGRPGKEETSQRVLREISLSTKFSQKKLSFILHLSQRWCCELEKNSTLIDTLKMGTC